MTTRTSFTPGMPCWADVSTTDPPASRDFYAGLFGWRYEVGSLGYTIALLDGVPVAALSGVPAEAGEPVGWTPYLATDDIGKTAAAVGEHGGRVLHGPMRISGRGSMLIGADPAGAAIGFWQPSRQWRCALFEPGALWWAELYTDQPDRADAFFASLFGYRQEAFGPGRGYLVWYLDDVPYLGRAGRPVEGGPHWMIYLVAPEGSDADAVAERAGGLGGTVLRPPYDHSHGRAVLLADPGGARFTVLGPIRAPGRAATGRGAAS